MEITQKRDRPLLFSQNKGGTIARTMVDFWWRCSCLLWQVSDGDRRGTQNVPTQRKYKETARIGGGRFGDAPVIASNVVEDMKGGL